MPDRLLKGYLTASEAARLARQDRERAALAALHAHRPDIRTASEVLADCMADHADAVLRAAALPPGPRRAPDELVLRPAHDGIAVYFGAALLGVAPDLAALPALLADLVPTWDVLRSAAAA